MIIKGTFAPRRRQRAPRSHLRGHPADTPRVSTGTHWQTRRAPRAGRGGAAAHHTGGGTDTCPTHRATREKSTRVPEHPATSLLTRYLGPTTIRLLILGIS